MKKIIDVCTRVEGHGQINYMFHENQISNVVFEIKSFRGFENILLNKRLEDTPKIVSRICGLCHVAQTLASYKAIEDMFEIQPTEQTILIRHLLMIGDHIKSHITHIFFQTFPDLLFTLKNIKNYSSPVFIIKYDPEITSNMFELIKNSTLIVNILGGRILHPITPAIGGFYYYPKKQDLEHVRRFFKNSYSNLIKITDRFIELFLKTSPPDLFSYGKPVFLGLNNNTKFDIYEGTLRIKNENDILSYIPKEKYNQYLYKEDFGEIYLNFNGEKKLLVGPIGRYKVVENYEDDVVDNYLDYFNRTWKSNIFFWNFLALLELIILTNRAISILENNKLTKIQPLTTLNIKNKGEGIGILEAPRGTLIHHYKVDEKNRLNNIKLFIPTEMNIPTINKVLTSYCKSFCENKSDLEAQDLEEMKRTAQIIVRNFDPCISCATHIIKRSDKNGNE
ncbi:MAG: nickel-dependent hydrogenase large subunit [Candidatus Helarchaeota archaeon]